MEVRSHILIPSVARGIAVLCAAVFVAAACPAQAGINVWTSHGPGVAFVTALARRSIEGGRSGGIDGEDADVGVVSHADVDRGPGGVYKSTDGGTGWGAVNMGLQFGNTSVSALAIDDRTTPRTLYAATVGSADDRTDGGVYKSTDGGDTWNAADTGLPANTAITALAMDPTAPSTLYSATNGGVYKSTDGGDTWNAANAGLPAKTSINALAIDPTTPRTLYAATNYPRVYKSTDGGSTWNAASTGLPDYSSVLVLAIAPTTPSTLYAGTYPGVYKSTDGASSWQAANAGMFYTSVHALAIDPTTPGTLYAGTESNGRGLYKSTDSASSWQLVNAGLNEPTVLALTIDPTKPSTIYAGTRSSGVYKSTDGASSWQAFNAGLSNTVNALAIDPTIPSMLYAGSDGGGVFAIDQVSFCVGDCSGTATVAINDLVALVSIALGDEVSACPNGLPADSDVDVAVLIEAVNNALHGCGG